MNILLLGVLVGLTCFSPACFAQDEDVRDDLYGDPLPAGAIARAGSMRLKQGREVEKALFSSDGREVASWSRTWKGELVFCRWETATGKLIAKYEFPKTKMMLCRYLGAGKALALLRSNDHKLYFWDFLAEGNPPEIPGDVFAPPRSRDDEWWGQFELSPDGQTLAATTTSYQILGLRKRAVHLWKYEHGKTLEELELLHELPREMNDILSIKFTDDGSRLVAVSQNEDPTAVGRSHMPVDVFVWDVETGEIIKRFDGGTISWKGNFKAIALSPMGTQMAVCVPGNFIAVFDLESGKLTSKIPCTHWWQCMTYTDRGLIVGDGLDGVIKIWDVSKNEIVRQFGAHWAMEVIAQSPDGKKLVTGGQDNMIRLWDIESGSEVHSFDGHENLVYGLKVSSDDSWFVTGGTDGKLCYWETETGNLIRSRRINGRIYSIDLSHDDRYLAAASHEEDVHTLHVFDAQSEEGNRQIELPDFLGGFNTIAFANKNKWLITGRQNEATVDIWDRDSGELVQQLDVRPAISKTSDGQRVNAVAVSGDGKLLAIGSSAGYMTDYVHVFDLPKLNDVSEFASMKGGVESIDFFPNGLELVTGGESRHGGPEHSDELRDSVQIRLIETCEVLSQFPGVRSSPSHPPRRTVHDVAVSPDGRLIATAEKGGTIEIYDVIRETSYATLTHADDVYAVKFTHDGSKLISLGSDLCALVWEVRELGRRR